MVSAVTTLSAGHVNTQVPGAASPTTTTADLVVLPLVLLCAVVLVTFATLTIVVPTAVPLVTVTVMLIFAKTPAARVPPSQVTVCGSFVQVKVASVVRYGNTFRGVGSRVSQIKNKTNCVSSRDVCGAVNGGLKQ